MRIRITADSTCDLSPAYIAEHNITVIPLTVTMGGRDYTDGLDIAPDDIFRHVDAGGELPKTAAVNAEAYRERFQALLQDCDAIIHFNISADFSSCYEHAVAAAEGLHVPDARTRGSSSAASPGSSTRWTRRSSSTAWTSCTRAGAARWWPCWARTCSS